MLTKKELMRRSLYQNIGKIFYHNYLVDELSRALLELGFDNESLIVSQRIIMRDYDKTSVETIVDIFPLYRIKTTKSELNDIVENSDVMIEENWRGFR